MQPDGDLLECAHVRYLFIDGRHAADQPPYTPTTRWWIASNLQETFPCQLEAFLVAASPRSSRRCWLQRPIPNKTLRSPTFTIALPSLTGAHLAPAAGGTAIRLTAHPGIEVLPNSHLTESGSPHRPV